MSVKVKSKKFSLSDGNFSVSLHRAAENDRFSRGNQIGPSIELAALVSKVKILVPKRTVIGPLWVVWWQDNEMMAHYGPKIAQGGDTLEVGLTLSTS